MIPFKLNYTVDSVQGILNFTMDVEMLAHFDEWQRTREDEVYEAQDQWPTELHRTRVIPAVDYLQVCFVLFASICFVQNLICNYFQIHDTLIWFIFYEQAQRARTKLIQEVKKSFTVDAFIGNATDWEKVCLGNLVGLPVIVVPTGFKNISDPPPGTLRRTTITTGFYAPPNHDHIVSFSTLRNFRFQ